MRKSAITREPIGLAEKFWRLPHVFLPKEHDAVNDEFLKCLGIPEIRNRPISEQFYNRNTCAIKIWGKPRLNITRLGCNFTNVFVTSNLIFLQIYGKIKYVCAK